MAGLKYDRAYEEPVTLRDGTEAWVRLLRPSDAGLLAAGFDRLSPESRYRRFLSAKTSLSAEELRYLTEVDGVDHFAIGAVRRLPDGVEEGLGIARFVRLPGEPAVAEAAIAIVDDAQRQGLGRALLRRLAGAAAERGVERFRCDVLESNAPIRRLLGDLACDVTRVPAGDGVVGLEVDVADLAAPPAVPNLADRLIGLAAEGLIVVRRAFGRPPVR